MANVEKAKWILPPVLSVVFHEFLSLYQSLYSKTAKSIRKSPLLIIGPPGVGKTLFSDTFVNQYQEEHKILDNKIKRINIAAIPK
jgi:Cdc6-like AAA superfamily ATPase